MEHGEQGHLHSSGAPAASQKPVLTFDQIQNVQQLKAGRCVVPHHPSGDSRVVCCGWQQGACHLPLVALERYCVHISGVTESECALALQQQHGASWIQPGIISRGLRPSGSNLGHIVCICLSCFGLPRTQVFGGAQR